MQNCFQNNFLEAGCDEAGRGCLAGPVFAAAVILPEDFDNKELRDSKKLSAKKRDSLRVVIEQEALAYAVVKVSVQEIDSINILNASILAMHKAIEALTPQPEFLSIDGNRFHKYKSIQHQCVVRGDDLYQNIAAASVLAKTHRDEYMMQIHDEYPMYQWAKNKGYGTAAHVQALREYGYSPFHRKTFHVKSLLSLKLDL
ncbi:MAG: ribonuclease HII [Weeksellaceae bacterium]|nr:ribonuclease HII [Weeksellaceae bacterium]